MCAQWQGPLRKSGVCRYTIPQDYKPGMRVPGVIYTDERLLDALRDDEAAEQVANVAFLPGIVHASLAMPDIHMGYGFAIGGVAATDIETGVISPGGVGYDINCGVRVITSTLEESRVRGKMGELLSAIFSRIPVGTGSKGHVKTPPEELKRVLARGASWAVERGYGVPADLEHSEENGAMPGANPDAISSKALARGDKQIGTLGSGNHFIEVSLVDQIYDTKCAEAFGLAKSGVVFQIHSGSRGLGHQVCTDYIGTMIQAVKKYAIEIPDRQLVCAPVRSPEGENYYGAMAAAANFAWANRQVMTHSLREAVASVFGAKPESLGLDLLYDVAHNIAKIETHRIEGKMRSLCVHRKGATRAFGPGHPSIPEKYRKYGQPVLVPGDMGRSSYIMVGTEVAMRETFGSCCHGAGRLMSRTSAKKEMSGRELQQRLAAQGITVRAGSVSSLAEEAPDVYKDIDIVADIAEKAGLGRKVARLVPMGVIKG